jgi:predicted ester cyclase
MTPSKIEILTCPLLVAAAVALAEPAIAAAENLPKPRIVTVATKQPTRAVEAEMLPARRYYAFWNTGEEHYAIDALAPDFIDLNLPEGRPQGPQGPLVASRGFREAVPDLEVTVAHAWIDGDQVISQLHFSGHFTGHFQRRAGDGRSIAFDAVDIYTIREGRIASNWHLEDNLSLLKQFGIFAP